jgi:hypothetical protein
MNRFGRVGQKMTAGRRRKLDLHVEGMKEHLELFKLARDRGAAGPGADVLRSETYKQKMKNLSEMADDRPYAQMMLAQAKQLASMQSADAADQDVLKEKKTRVRRMSVGLDMGKLVVNQQADQPSVAGQAKTRAVDRTSTSSLPAEQGSDMQALHADVQLIKRTLVSLVASLRPNDVIEEPSFVD